MSNKKELLEIKHHSPITSKTEFHILDINKINLPLIYSYANDAKAYVVQFSYKHINENDKRSSFTLAFSSQIDAEEFYDVMYNIIIGNKVFNNNHVKITDGNNLCNINYKTGEYRYVRGK